jgi:hypothetical protein
MLQNHSGVLLISAPLPDIFPPRIEIRTATTTRLQEFPVKSPHTPRKIHHSANVSLTCPFQLRTFWVSGIRMSVYTVSAGIFDTAIAAAQACVVF